MSISAEAETESTNAAQLGARQRLRVGLACAVVVAGMVGVAYAAVPLYRIFCQVTGYGGTTNQASAAPGLVLDRDMTIRFDANVSRTMPWSFQPLQTAVTLKVGETALALYRAHNPTDHPITGTATFNITPQQAGYYFTKIECFCFTEQTLQPGETVEMPVTFFVDPEIADDHELDSIKTITLSYTFFPKKDQAASLE